MYYNTTNEKGEKLKDHQEKALSQEKKILQFFKNQTKFFNDRELGIFTSTSSRMHQFLFLEGTLLPSIRRAVTTLVKNGDLEYTGKYVPTKANGQENVIKLKQ